jgi:hypothetical protein
MRHPFLRSAGSELKDPNFKNVTLLLHGDGTNGGQNNTFVDGSTNNFTITRNGNTTQGTFSPYGDNWSNFFDGTGDYLTVPDNAAFDFGTGDFTIELWVYIAGNSALNNNSTRDTTVVASFPTTIQTLTNSWGLNISGSGTTTGTGISFSNWQSGSNSVISATVTVPQNSWNHIAVARLGTTTKLFLNGAEVGSGTLSNQTVNSGQNLAVGRLGYPGYIQELNGYISNLRVLKGTAQYTGSYTIPTAPLTAITNTSLLTCQSNRFRDASTNNFTITRNGDVSVQRFSPFSPTAAYAAGTIGGSGYFDGTGDYLQLTAADEFNLAGDFTVEAWIYRTTTGSQRIVGKWNLAGNLAWVLETSTTAIAFGVANSGTFSASLSFNATINLFAWNHVAVSRSGSTVRAFLNGVDLGSATSSANCTANNTNPIRIGQTENVNYVNGYVCDVRVLKGTAQYTAAFTPPTAPLTAITNTSLLLNFTNAAILDNAMMSVLETVGDAQIDTAVKKYGTGSMEFDAIGDRMITPGSPDNAFGTGNFTIEFWVYRTGGGQRAFISTRTTSTTGWSVSTDGSNRVLFNYDSSSFSTSSTLANNTWYHIAVVREGTGTNQTKIYINGTSSATGTVASDFTPSGIAIAVNRSSTDASAGYFDDVRITKGVARYTTNFTPPTAPFPNL